MKMPRQDRDLRELLRDLGRALTEAIADSPEVGRTLRRIRREGYTLQLLLDCKREESENDEPVVVAASTGDDPAFRIDARDLSFLRSIGIDPTRRLKRRKS